MSGERGPDPSVVAYDLELVPWLFGPWAEAMVDLVAPGPGDRVVDLACGSGLIVRQLSSRIGASGEVHGVDIDAAMLAYAATTVDDQRVSWHESDAARLPFGSGSVDRVSCHQGLQFFPERMAALAEIRRVLVPGGRLAVATWGRIEENPWPSALSDAVGRILGADAGAAMQVVSSLGEPAAVGELLDAAGFDEIHIEKQVRTLTHPDARAAVAGQLAALPSGSEIGELGHARRTELVDLMCELLADHLDTEGRLEVRSTSNFARADSPR